MTISPPGTLTFLLAAFRADAEPEEWQRQSATFDADKLAIAAIVLGLGPLLHWQLAAWNVTLAPRAWAKLQSARSASAERQYAIQTQLREILVTCAESRLTPIVLKGAFLACHIYPAPGLRTMNDIDILVRPDDLPLIESALQRLGYLGHFKDPAAGARVVKHTSTFRRPAAAVGVLNPYLNAGADRTVEPHVSLEESWFGLRADMTPGVWERSIAIDFEGHALRALCPSDLMLHLCVHLSFHLIMGWPSLVQLLDLLWVSRKLAEADWEQVAGRAGERSIAGYIYAALRLARVALAAPVPEQVLARLAAGTPAAVRAHAESLSAEDVMQRAQRPPPTTMHRRLARSVHERAEAARWARSLQERLLVWGTLVDVAHTDTGMLLAARLRLAAGRYS